MFVLGIQGSPRKKGNTAHLLSLFMDEAKQYGAQTEVIETAKSGIVPCKGCGLCEKKGFCVIDDDPMSCDVYQLLRRADVIVAAGPVFFYNIPSQMKALIDRSQALWSRKYRLKLSDPASHHRRGVMLSQGATMGENLFEGIYLTMKYFFDACNAGFDQCLTYRRIEEKNDLKNHTTVSEDVRETARKIFEPLAKRKNILFACRDNTCHSQMAAAFAMHLGGDKFDVFSAGGEPAEAINPQMVEAMAEKGIDMAFRAPVSMKSFLLSEMRTDLVITLDSSASYNIIPDAKTTAWDLPDAGETSAGLIRLRDEIEKKVLKLVNSQI